MTVLHRYVHWYTLLFNTCTDIKCLNPNQSGKPADSKGVAVGILIPTDVGLLIPTPQCPSFGTVKNGKNAWLWELGWGT